LKIYRVLFFENRPTPVGHPIVRLSSPNESAILTRQCKLCNIHAGAISVRSVPNYVTSVCVCVRAQSEVQPTDAPSSL